MPVLIISPSAVSTAFVAPSSPSSGAPLAGRSLEKIDVNAKRQLGAECTRHRMSKTANARHT